MSSHVKRAGDDVVNAVAKRYGQVHQGVPAHVRLASALRDTIAGGELLPGDLLPGDAALMDATGLARGTLHAKAQRGIDPHMTRAKRKRQQIGQTLHADAPLVGLGRQAVVYVK